MSQPYACHERKKKNTIIKIIKKQTTTTKILNFQLYMARVMSHEKQHMGYFQ